MMMISNNEKKVQYELCGSNLRKYSTVKYERGEVRSLPRLQLRESGDDRVPRHCELRDRNISGTWSNGLSVAVLGSSFSFITCGSK